MNIKIVKPCPNCHQKVRIPSGKHVKFVCPNCHEEVQIDDTIKNRSERKKSPLRKFAMTILFAFIGGALFGVIKSCFKVSNEIRTQQNAVLNDDESNLKKLIEAIDVGNPTTNDFAVRLASRFPGEYNIAQVCRIHDYIVKKWKYVSDSDKQEIFRSASRTIQNDFAGDCDDFAILMAALIESIGGDVRISFAQNQEEGHAFAEVYATDKEEEMQILVDDMSRLYEAENFEIKYYVDERGGCWLNLDWFGEHQHPGGEYFNFEERTIYYPFGYPNNDPNQRIPIFEKESQ